MDPAKDADPPAAGIRYLRQPAGLGGAGSRVSLAAALPFLRPGLEDAVDPLPTAPGRGVASELGDLRAAMLYGLLAEETQLTYRINAVHVIADAPPVTAEMYFRLLTVRAEIVRTLAADVGADMHDAREVGLSWEEIAEARTISVEEARDDFGQWIDAQAALWESGVVVGGRRLGLSRGASDGARGFI
ncbi:hypothetical protein [Cryptosporangium sp. NPDC051539]|uniref:hypothetical protein n=1 Tax=Cryptosporangium sp. NPDC051539 TaxID=3363962 RepID=UPI0037A78DFC